MSKKSLTTKKPLYIFFHTQKCAGSTLRYHLERNFQEDEVIFLYLHGHFDVRNKIHEPFRTKKFREAVDTYLSRLTGEQKDRVRVLCGHEIYYGIHQFFPNKEPKYVTFVSKETEDNFEKLKEGKFEDDKNPGIFSMPKMSH